MSLSKTSPPKGCVMPRRQALRLMAASTAGLATMRPRVSVAQEPQQASLTVNPSPLFELSAFLHMQFMEPLGSTDGSVEAAWDHLHDDWRPDVVNATRDLAPTMLRWGGIFADFYRWREGVGPRAQRPPMLNLCWGGMESNQVGTTEFVDFARRIGAEPLICVNFESDGRQRYLRAKGSVRTANAQEAADWVAYCNAPGSTERRAHGSEQPLGIRYWQIGNETSYDRNGFDLETAAKRTVEFAGAMRRADPTIQLIAWGDSGWAARMAEIAGDQVQYLAFHHMFDPDNGKQPVLRGELYRRDPEATWQQLMEAWKINDRKIREIRASRGNSQLPLAMTECHFAIPGRNRCDVLSTWAAGVSYARLLMNHQRHGDVLKIATAADFCGTRWQVNAVMIPVPAGKAYLMPVARVMRLFRHHIGSHAVSVVRAPEGLDVVASRRGKKLFLHAVNTQRNRAVRAQLGVAGAQLTDGRVLQIAEDPMLEVSPLNSSAVMIPVEKPLPQSGTWEFPAASVSAVELDFV
jgi:alpha-L-arabinofuranosidase